MAPADEQDMQFGPFQLDLRHCRLSRDGISLPASGRALNILAALIAAAGETVAKGVLLDRAWPGVTVEENNLQVQVSALRKVLGDGWIITVPGRGYRLMMPQDARTLQDRHTKLHVVMQSVPDRPSIAILPFANMSSNPDQEFFSDGIADDVTTELSRNRSLFVIARNSSFAYKGRSVDVKHVASELGVRYVLEGSTRRDGERVRINVQLVDAERGNHVWAERYDRRLTDIFAVQDEITRAVISEIVPAISDAERVRAIQKSTADLNAWEAYHRGLWHISRASNKDVDKGLEFLVQAVAQDPLFVEAHATLARFYLSEATRGGSRSLHDSLALAEFEARTALQLDDANANAHASLAWVLDHLGEQVSALHEAERAIVLNANDPTGYLIKGHVLTFTHRPADAKIALDVALRLDPRGPTAPTVRHHFAVGFFLERDYASAVVAASEAIRINPAFPRTYLYLVASLGHLGRKEEARRVLDEAMPAAQSFFQFTMARRPPWYLPADYEHLIEGMRKADWKL